jgi:hypothetical protein
MFKITATGYDQFPSGTEYLAARERHSLHRDAKCDAHSFDPENHDEKFVSTFVVDEMLVFTHHDGQADQTDVCAAEEGRVSWSISMGRFSIRRDGG